MSKLGKALISAIEDAKENGVITLTPSTDVAKLRKHLKLTQQHFAEIYHINPETLKKWEQHKREPDSISRAYLKCIEKNPEIIRELVNS
jgi:DNA-binding transcriptional regulator YiaG